jgi:hypothetical protein
VLPLTNLLDDLLDDLSRPGMPWQLGAIAACTVFGWLAARLVQSGGTAAATARTAWCTAAWKVLRACWRRCWWSLS